MAVIFMLTRPKYHQAPTQEQLLSLLYGRWKAAAPSQAALALPCHSHITRGSHQLQALPRSWHSRVTGAQHWWGPILSSLAAEHGPAGEGSTVSCFFVAPLSCRWTSGQTQNQTTAVSANQPLSAPDQGTDRSMRKAHGPLCTVPCSYRI